MKLHYYLLLGIFIIFPQFLLADVISSYTGGTNDFINFTTSTKYDGQSFEVTGGSYNLTSVSLQVWRSGSPGMITVELKATSGGLPTGAVLSSGTFNGDTITTGAGGDVVDVAMSPYALTEGLVYAFYVKGVGGASLRWNINTPGGTTAVETWVDSTNSGSTWTEPDPSYIFYYSVNGDLTEDVVVVASSTGSTTSDIVFGIAIIITLMSLGLIGFVWNRITPKKKNWQK